jgi:MFS transporter, YNFM family, putative membrane transport protein
LTKPLSLLPVVLAGFTAFLSLYATQPLLPLFQSVFGAGHFAVSLTVTATTTAVALAAPFVGRLADAWGKPRVIVAAAFTLSAATILASTAATLNQVIGWRFVQGLVTPGVFAVAVAYIHDRWDPSRAGRATAAYVTGTVIGGFVGRATSGIMASRFGWRASFAAVGGMSLACAIVLSTGLRGDGTHSTVSRDERRARSLTSHLTSRELASAYAAGFCVLFTQVAMFTYVTFHLADEPFGLSTAALGWLFAVYLAGAVITPISGRWIDVHGHRTALVAAIAIGVTGSLLTLAGSLWLVVAGLALVSSGVFVAQAAASSYVGAAATHDRGLAVGLYAMFYYAGGSVGGALPAVFWASGGWPACVALVVGIQFMTAAIGWARWSAREGDAVRTAARV